MLNLISKAVFGSRSERFVKSLRKDVAKIDALESKYEQMNDDELVSQTDIFRQRLESGEKLDNILHEAFAVVREASKRVLGLRHYGVQLIGGMVLHRGMIAEMKTGEGKTLVATLAVYLNAIAGKGVHVVTVNDYLARRDSEWMGKLYNFLGLSVGCIVHNITEDERRAAYQADITYGTNNEFGFDYLRDNMKYSLEDMVQRPFNFAIVDEVDSILIDEARTPLIISGAAEGSSELYIKINELIPLLSEEHYEIDEKGKNVMLTDVGVEFVEQQFLEIGMIAEGSGLYDMKNIALVHHVNQALKAHKMFNNEVDYIVTNNQVVIIDEFTGRMMEGRRYGDGLHQAIEAKEGVPIQKENQTLASVTFQNYFRLYPKLAGMTGTAQTEAEEFADIYGLGVVPIPTHRAVSRADHDDEIYRSVREKYDAIIELITECQERGQPVLVGTVSIERSELLAKMLKKNNIKHNVLNAKHHEQEAYIIAQAGRYGAVTIATNMAGRGTDIMLGGNAEMMIEKELGEDDGSENYQRNAEKIRQQVAQEREKVSEAGGLFVIGTERHESRRIDNQLRGRSGRQGDAGASKFFLSLEDDLMRIFGSDKMEFMLEKLGMEEGEAIHHPWMTKALQRAQKKVEGRNYDIRKNLLKFDNVMNDQRQVIYEERRSIMSSDDVSGDIEEIYHDIAENIALNIKMSDMPHEDMVDSVQKEILRIYGRQISEQEAEEILDNDSLQDYLSELTHDILKDKEERFSAENMRIVEKRILLQSLDEEWKEHLHQLDHLRQGIHLRAYGQRDPLNEYKKEAFGMFENMLYNMREKTIMLLCLVEIRGYEEEEELAGAYDPYGTNNMKELHGVEEASGNSGGDGAFIGKVDPENRDPNDPSTWGKVGRNELCPCGSGKKYKQCHGKI